MRVIGVPFSSAGRPDHEALAPKVLRDAGLIERLRDVLGSGEPVTDGGNVDIGTPAVRGHRDGPSGLRYLRGLEAVTATARSEVARTLLDGERPLVLGGDCAILPGCLRGTQDALGNQVGLLFIDGHEDAWPPHESDTGEAADCELGFLLGMYRDQLPASLEAQLPVLDESAVVALGPRDGDEIAGAEDVPSLAESNRLITAQQLTAGQGSAAEHARKALARIRTTTSRWWLHIDLDVLSSDALHAVGYTQPGGLNWNQLSELAATALGEPGCVGITVCCYDPDRDPDGTGAQRILDWAGSLPAGGAPSPLTTCPPAPAQPARPTGRCPQPPSGRT